MLTSLRANARSAMLDGHSPSESIAIAHHMKHDAMHDGHETEKSRDDLESEDFGLPAERKYPMGDISHARNAESRASQNASPSQRKQIDAKAHRLFPSIGSGK